MTTLTPNAQRLLRALVSDGPAFRADLARALDVTRATVTNLTQALGAEGWIVELDTGGSLKQLIGTTPRLGVLASVVFLVDTCTAVLSHLDGRIMKEVTIDGGSHLSAADRLSSGEHLISRLLRESGTPETALRAIHLAVDTQMDAASGEIFAEGASRRWYGVNPKVSFHDRFRVPVHVQNSARLAGLAESVWGAGRGHGDMLYVEVGHGVASGHITNGVIASGARGGSGELGHMVYDWNGPACTCGNPGCVMQYVSIPALLRDYAHTTGEEIDWAAFVERTTRGDAIVCAIADRAATILGRAIVNACHLLDPGTVVLSGEVASALPDFIDRVAATVRDGALPLVGRQLHIAQTEIEDAPRVTARAGIEFLRRRSDILGSGVGSGATTS